MTSYSTAFIGLGSNLDKPHEQIDQALTALAKLASCKSLECAPWYSSKAIGPKGQPDYINTVARLKTLLSPAELLTQLQGIENAQGRQRLVHWGARTLDLDLLLYDNLELASEKLTIPHPEIQNRNFVLLPLYDLSPTLILPNGEKLETLAKQCDQHGLRPLNRDIA
ncbi:MAG: 2-amino-4-hydroxy-6-hydroxymethyldihydropteridine diphosphokinase [Cellvibrionaceae bacterium]